MDSLKLIDDYVKWYKENVIVKNCDGYSELITPYVNHLNDRIRLYVEMTGEQTLRISDDGQTLNELELFGLDVTTKTRQTIIFSVLRQFGTQLDGDLVYIDTDIKHFPKAKHKLIQTIIRLYDLVTTRRSIITSLFAEEVQDYLFQSDIGGTPNVKLTGRSGIDYQVDYIVGARKNRPEIWIQTLNRFDFNSFTTLDYTYRDISEGRGANNQAKKLLIYNDLENQASNKALQAAKQSEIVTIPWSVKSDVLQLIR